MIRKTVEVGDDFVESPSKKLKSLQGGEENQESCMEQQIQGASAQQEQVQPEEQNTCQIQDHIGEPTDAQGVEQNEPQNQTDQVQVKDECNDDNDINKDVVDADLDFFSDEDSDDDSDSDKEAKEISKEELNARRMAVFDTLSNMQMDRYECFRRASFQKSKMARVMKYVLRQNVNERMIISMQGIAKLFVPQHYDVGWCAL
eukprot:TRINITY_DN589_c0_g1_i5.p1 TRINITY_DN589_c0_g1~~TRINITY_DN589_c0_g1_i5.p1  ORF type:complete len:202 (+),score=43.96 TRINITY_DN589_c0_g1_i5:43-648(+)